ncbi:helix-turn-helix domain-containing protein [Streptomyces canus]
MRYAQGGGLSDERRQFREGIRMKAAEAFARGEPSSGIARELRVSVRSVQRWRRAWDKGWDAGAALGGFDLRSPG